MDPVSIVLLLKNNWRIVAAALGLFTVFSAGWMINGWRHDAREALLRQEYAEQVTRAQQKADRERAALENRLALVDQQRMRELTHAQDELNRLRASLSAGSGSLHVNASCPAGVPGAAAGAGLGAAAGPRPTAGAERNYLLLREQINQVTEQLKAAQGMLIAERAERDR